MKTALIMITIALTATINTVTGQGINFEHTEWSRVLRKAEVANRYVFVDFYATWCGPCKYMSRDVFTSEKAGKFFNDNFVSYKVDAEKEEEQLVESVNLEAYPTLAFFDASGKLIYKHVGAADEDQLVEIGKKVLSYKKERAAVLRNQGTREQVMAYLLIAKHADPENYAKMAPGIVKSLTIADFDNANAWELFRDNVKDMTNPIFLELTKDPMTYYEKLDGYASYIDDVMNEYFVKMADAGNLAGLELYKKTMHTLHNKITEDQREYNYYSLEVDARYYLHREENEKYASTVTLWVNTYLTENWNKLSENAVELTKHVKSQKHFQNALAWAKKAVALERNKHTVYSLAVVYQNTGDKTNAIKCAEEVLTFELDEEEETFIQGFLEELRS